MIPAILPFSPEHAAAFDALNRAWIEEYFTVEPIDDQVLRDPETYILKPGGEIWCAVRDGRTLGVCALRPYAEGMFEFTKLAVDPAARGLGIARTLLRHCRDRATAKGAHTLRIYTNTRLTVANRLYRQERFAEVPMTDAERTRYQRADIMYDLPLR